MPFQKGNKLSPGGRKGGKGGRPTAQQQAAKQVAAERARERLEAEVDEVMDEYLRLAKGGKVEKGSSPQTVRHCVERWLPSARQGIDVSVDSVDSLEKYYQALEAAERLERERQHQAIEPGESKTKGELSYDQRKKTNP